MDTQNKQVKKHLERFGTITQRQADMDYGIMRLGARIFELREKPYSMNIESRLIRVTNRRGKPCHVAKYVLVK